MRKTGYAFQLHNVAYSYPDGTPALRGLTLSIEAGEKVAILGANGSGKSTLLKIMDGLYFSSAGEVVAFGQPLSEEALADDGRSHEFRRQVGLVFQDADVQLFCPTVWDEVAFGPLQLGITPEEVLARVERALKLLRIEKLAERPPHKLSGGEKKKVAIASVLSLQPSVLLLDEPTANLDPRSRSQVVDLLLEMNSGGTTIVAATHDLDIVELIADRAYVLDEAHNLVAEGPTEDILADSALLTRANLVHEHIHSHNGITHIHPHAHASFHDHAHSNLPPPRKT